MAAQWESDYLPGADLLARFFDALAVDADVSGFNDGLRESPAFHQPDKDEESVDPHFFLSLASSAGVA